MEIIALLAYTVIFCITSVFLLFYFKRIRSETVKYIEARKIIEDVIFSFNKDLKRIEEKIQEIIESHREVSVGRDLEEMRSLVLNLKEKVEDLIRNNETICSEHKDLKNKIDSLMLKYNEVVEKISKIEEEKIFETEKKEINRTGSPILPRGDKVLTSLTETELKVLEILANEGEKTASEIKDRIKLTREHTARLLKSLYMRGYVERKEDKIPYVYRLNKDMEEILKKERLFGS